MEGQRGCGYSKLREESTMVRVKHREDMGESTSPQRIQLEVVVLKDKNDGKEMETDNGQHAGLLHLPVSFPILSLTFSNSCTKCTKTEVNAGHGGFSGYDMYRSLVCLFIRVLLSHSAHRLTHAGIHAVNTVYF